MIIMMLHLACIYIGLGAGIAVLYSMFGNIETDREFFIAMLLWPLIIIFHALVLLIIYLAILLSLPFLIVWKIRKKIHEK